ncbi:Bifunctional aspartate aminotransferase and glutamate/aspartate-prephenate aminotransferase [Seminavis robusta]|uniref:Bifunctional aspartate aminotransferase and glutamate/aspartate-prephenate aminotransferase n=1 Tax=Seminavis robusta TaxID=568900 RepID=A0A9N8HQ38_9STRA|nr:Bifunctional aspartate aminotransferase and glutamate/aspartate-prephenate aminotransferase [Seminavis robusta]|eukprot:Sro1397_g269170.1 Bifunctional aspartate aminotransferase and glutamate/aspartate-prephenate aminotransferase (485) ;mRNA; r:13745-15199
MLPTVLYSAFASSCVMMMWLPSSRAFSRREAIGRIRSRLFQSSSSSSVNSFSLASRLDGLDKPTVWHEFTPLAIEHNAVNLGQGFPDWDPPAFAVEAMRRATDPSLGRHANQYARSYAHLPLAQVLAEDYSQRFGRDINPETQIATAVGCTNALYCSLQGLVNPGDEVLLLEPAFDIYMSSVQMAGGVPVYCPLRPSTDDESTMKSASLHFTLDLDELEAKLTSKTKVLLLNTPHNPTGKMFSRTELEGISKLLEKYPHVTVLSDEVYEHIVFDTETEPHISPATIDGLWEKTLTLSSSGKTFSCTGWKVGWAVGPPHLVKALSAVQQWVNFSAPTPNQDAIAQSLLIAKQEAYEGYPSFYDYLAADYKRKRGLLTDALQSAGMTPVIPPGGFFIMADTSHISDFDYDPTQVTPATPTSTMPRDWALSRWLTQTVGVTAIPPSAFYSEPNVPLAKNLLRFAFCKGDDTILEAHKRLEAYFGKTS